jgi:membrane-associated phospholipid phosphatase
VSSPSINTTWYLDVNRLARESAWAHGAMATYSHFLGIGLLALTLLAAWWWARRAADAARNVAAVVWAATGTVVAWVVAHVVLKPAVHEARPYQVLPHVEVLLARTHGGSFPSGHATVVGAVVVGLLLARRWLAGLVATLLGLLLAFGRVYTGMHYPFDVLAGLAFGALVVAVLWPVAVPVLTGIDRVLLRTRLAPLVARGATGGAGPLSRPALRPLPAGEGLPRSGPRAAGQEAPPPRSG